MCGEFLFLPGGWPRGWIWIWTCGCCGDFLGVGERDRGGGGVDSARFWCVGVRDFGSGGIGCCRRRGVVLVGIESA